MANKIYVNPSLSRHSHIRSPHPEVIRFLTTVIGDDGKKYYVGLASQDDQIEFSSLGGDYSQGARRAIGTYYAVIGTSANKPFRRAGVNLFERGNKGEFNLDRPRYLHAIPGPHGKAGDVLEVLQWGDSNGDVRRFFWIHRGVLTPIAIYDRGRSSFDVYAKGVDRKGLAFESGGYRPGTGSIGTRYIFEPSSRRLRVTATLESHILGSKEVWHAVH